MMEIIKTTGKNPCGFFVGSCFTDLLGLGVTTVLNVVNPLL
jgi:hypothetical protein